MQPLDRTLRSQLERGVRQARRVAEQAARAALDALGVADASVSPHLDEARRLLRRRLRAHARSLGDTFRNGGSVPERLIAEVAYEHWHRMLFARFLAENDLLMYDGVAITLEECAELAPEEGAASEWELAARLAAGMLPQVFRIESPVFALRLAPEYQRELEGLLAGLSPPVFQASDSLGWVYQFWQADAKDRINQSEVKIGARELPAVTQLFTEPYMVSFLLDNALGAWWAARRLTEVDLRSASSEEELRQKAAIPGVPLEYLRFVRLPSPSGRGAGGEGKKTPIPDDILRNARELRQNQTDAEQLLWKLLRDRRFAGKKFRRQHPVDRYILDFYCQESKLAIELDGGQHSDEATKQYDEDRTRYLNEHGIRVIRFWNNQVLQETDAVLESLWSALTPTPLPEGEGLLEHPSPSGRSEGDEGDVWTPAAGRFEAWPEQLAELKVLDPCCGSGHFLVAVLLMLTPMRMELEGLSAREAIDAVLRENLHGLEIDQRCVEIAAFALALTAWRYPGAGGYRPLPELNLACSGLPVAASKDKWKQLGLGRQNLSIALDWMHDTFRDAPVLGSLLNPASSAAAKVVRWEDLAGLLEQALAEDTGDEGRESAVMAYGLAKAAPLLAGQYHWVVTNVPYLARGKQSELLRKFCERHYPAAKNDLATVFLDRCLELASHPSPSGRGAGGGTVSLPSPPGRGAGGEGAMGGTVSLVLPQNWLFLTSYRKFREKLLREHAWHLIARLGEGGFDSSAAAGAFVAMLHISAGNTTGTVGGLFDEIPMPQALRGLDVSAPRTAAEKAAGLLVGGIKTVEQAGQLGNPDSRIAFGEDLADEPLSELATAYWGQGTGDFARFGKYWWEVDVFLDAWELGQSTIDKTTHYSGRVHAVYWQKGKGELVKMAEKLRHRLKNIHYRGAEAWNKKGLSITMIRTLRGTLYTGQIFDGNCGAITIKDPAHLPAIWCFCSSPEYNEAVRRIDQKLNVTNATLVKVPFDLDHWSQVAAERYPNGLPQPYTDDPTQWIFHGHPCGSVIWDEATKWTADGMLRTDDSVLQIAVARLLGYRWPAELDPEMELADEQRAWVRRCEALLPHADADGIVCIPAVRGEARAEDRLLNLLAAAYGDAWTTGTLGQLLASNDHADKSLESWLRDRFFTQHCKRFQNRPFIWHIWDGLRDGFAALVNYHRLDHKMLETLIYTYLGDWIRTQKDDIQRGVDGAQEKLAAAESLRKKLELILEGEAPLDIFVRWKPLAEQPIGWKPDLNDGVRLNIRPFLSVDDVGRKGAGVLRDKPNIHWKKDRGKDVESAPWYPLFQGDRINDHHLTLAEKRRVRRNGEATP